MSDPEEDSPSPDRLIRRAYSIASSSMENEYLEDEALDRVLGGPLDPQRHAIFVCGNPSMVEDLQGRFERLGFQLHRKGNPGNLHIERYW